MTIQQRSTKLTAKNKTRITTHTPCNIFMFKDKKNTAHWFALILLLKWSIAADADSFETHEPYALLRRQKLFSSFQGSKSKNCRVYDHSLGLFTGHSPRVGSGQKVFKISRVGSGRVGPGRVGLGGFHKITDRARSP